MTDLVERLRDAASHTFGHYAGDPEGALGLAEISDLTEAADALSRATDEEGLARVIWWGWVQEHSGWSLENWPDDVNSSVAEKFRERARAIIGHIKGEKKDG